MILAQAQRMRPYLTLIGQHQTVFYPIHDGVFQIIIFNGGLPASHVAVIGVSSAVSPRLKYGQSLRFKDSFDVSFPLFHDFLVFLAPTYVELKWLVETDFEQMFHAAGAKMER